MHGPRSQNAPERGIDQCEQPDGAGRWCGQLRATGMERCTRQRRTGRRCPMQTLHAIVTLIRSAQRSVQTLSGIVRANARRIRSAQRSVQMPGISAQQLDGIAAPARTVKVFSQRMPVFWLTLSISGDGLRPFGVKAISSALSALRYSLFSHVFIAKCRTQRPSARKPRSLSAINRQS